MLDARHGANAGVVSWRTVPLVRSGLAIRYPLQDIRLLTCDLSRGLTWAAALLAFDRTSMSSFWRGEECRCALQPGPCKAMAIGEGYCAQAQYFCYSVRTV